MLCPFCRETIADGAIKCKHCMSMLTAPATQQGTRAQAGGGNVGAGNANAIIEGLDVSPNLKQKLLLVHEHFKEVKFGGPVFNLKGTAVWATYSVWAFFFNFIYYFVKGMWQKGLVLLAISLLIQIIVAALHLPSGYALVTSNFVGLLAMQSAYYDLYRSKVLKETFWW